jgi:Tol biopolymer transport system component
MRAALTAPLFCLAAGCGSGDPLLAPATQAARRLAYLADGQQEEVFRLYVARYDGEVYDVSGPLTDGGDVLDYAWSPDERRVAFLADAFLDGTNQLFVADAASGVRTEVVTDLVPLGTVGFFRWIADGSRLAYVAESTTEAAFEISTVRPDGTGAVRLCPPFAAGQFVSRIQSSPDGAGVAYAANQDDPGQQELYVAPVDGSSPSLRVSGDFVADGQLAAGASAFAWSPDNARIAYLAQQDDLGAFELYASSPDGTGNVELSAPGPRTVVSFAWAPDGSRMAYYSDEDLPGRFELSTVLPDGTGRVRVSADPVPGGNVLDYAWSPDGTRLAYRQDQFLDEQFSLHVVAAEGGPSTTVSGPLQAEGVLGWAWAPDGSRLVYQARQDSLLLAELYTVRPDGTQNTRISGDFVVAGQILGFAWSPRSDAVAYLADVDAQNRFELYVAGALGGSTRVSGPTQTGIPVGTFAWTPDGSALVYLAQQVFPGVTELWRTLGNGTSIRMSALQGPGGNVVTFEQPGA